MQSLITTSNSTIELRDYQRTILQAIIKKYQELEKYRRFKLGCRPTECEMEEMVFLSEILCVDECIIDDEEHRKIIEKIQRYE